VGANSVHALQVEDALLAHPQVSSCAVVGVPHKALGESITAIISCDDEEVPPPPHPPHPPHTPVQLQVCCLLICQGVPEIGSHGPKKNNLLAGPPNACLRC